ncbi:MAG: TonB-dependent receptor [Panacagrimonas sp.]
MLTSPYAAAAVLLGAWSFGFCAAAEETSPADAEGDAPALPSGLLETIPVEVPSPDIVEKSEAENTATSARIDEIVVSAQKREENVRDVPISIQAFGGEDLAARGIENTRQLDRVVPSLQFASIAAFPLVFIRGLGSDNFVPSADPSIATYIDGIYVPNGAASVHSLSNIGRVEVLKGPQGTLFGRNATGGAISVVTREPGDDFQTSLEGQVGNFDTRSIKGNLSGPLTSWFSAALSGETQRRDAYYTHVTDDLPADELDAIRLKLLFRPSDALSISLSGYRSEQSGLYAVLYKNVDPSLLGSLAGMQPQEDNYVGEGDAPSSTEASQKLLFGTLSWELPWFDLKLLGSDQRHRGSGELDFDGSPSPVSALTATNVFTDLRTGELQLVSHDESWGATHFTWVAGLYYLESSAGFDPAVVQIAPDFVESALALTGLPVLTQLGARLGELFNAFGLRATPLGDGGLSLLARGVLDTRSYSAYVQGSFHLSDWMDLTLGGRAQREKRFLTQAQTDLSDFSGNGSTTVLPFDLQSARSSNFSPKAVVSLRPAHGAMVYLSYSVAYKSGTYNVVNTYVAPNYIVPERVYSVELGTKLEFADGSVRLDAALFDSHIRNLQSGFTSLLSGGIVQFFSVPRARSRGVEANLSWIPLPVWNPGLALTLNAAYVDAIYQEFPNGPGYGETLGLYSGTMDHSGNQLTHTPRRSGNVGVVQRIPLGQGVLEVAMDDYYNSKTYSTAQNGVPQESFAVLNGRVGYLYAPWNLSLVLFGQNLLDRRYHVLRGPTDFGLESTLAAPRQYGVRVGWQF